MIGLTTPQSGYQELFFALYTISQLTYFLQNRIPPENKGQTPFHSLQGKFPAEIAVYLTVPTFR